MSLFDIVSYFVYYFGMNYKKHYKSLISKRIKCPITFEYSERHHIIPKSLGGSNKKINIVRLTAKEHFIAHLLLTKMYTKGSNEYFKMIRSFALMCWYKSDSQDRYITSNEYSWLREAFSKSQSINQVGIKNSNYGKHWVFSRTLRKSKKIEKSQPIPRGFKKGRVINFDKLEETIKKKNKRDKNREDKISKYTDWYKIYAVNEFSKFCEITGCNTPQTGVAKLFKNHVKSFKPQNGKRRCIPEKLLNKIRCKIKESGGVYIEGTYVNSYTPFKFKCSCKNIEDNRKWVCMSDKRIGKIACKKCLKDFKYNKSAKILQQLV